MKKSNRIAKNNGISPSTTQVKRPSGKLSKRPEGSIRQEPTKKLLARLEKRRWHHEAKAAETRKEKSPALVNELRLFLGAKSFATLAEVEKEFGLSIEAQLGAAVGTWTAFVEWERFEHFGRTEESMRKSVLDAACAIDPGHVGFILEKQRPKMVSKRAAQFFLLSLRQQMGRPFDEARPILEGLRDLLEGHPGFVREEEALRDMLNGCELVESDAMADRAGLPRKD
jgi:hypothetical protein